MSIAAFVTATLAVVSAATPIWYIPVRRCSEYLGYPRARSGRVQRAGLIEWLNATDVGLFIAAILFAVALSLPINVE